MTAYGADHETHVPLCDDCIHGGCIASSTPCEAEDCRCDCGICGDGSHRADRARELDDRPDAALASIARDIEHETRAWPDQLHRERFPDHRQLLAERTRRTA